MTTVLLNLLLFCASQWWRVDTFQRQQTGRKWDPRICRELNCSFPATTGTCSEGPRSACARRTASGVENLSNASSPRLVNSEPLPVALFFTNQQMHLQMSLIVHLLYLIYRICENLLNQNRILLLSLCITTKLWCNKIVLKVSDCTITRLSIYRTI